jgi:sarcosine oxidase subunit alpha
MADLLRVWVNGREVNVPHGTSVAAAVLRAGVGAFRTSVTGEPRGPLCGMGICFECRATIDGVPHRRTCTLLARGGMKVRTDGGV